MDPSSSHLMHTASHVDPYSHDPKGINAHAIVTFDEVLGEPPTAMTTEWVWHNTQCTFNTSKDMCYMCLSGICGLPIAMCMGLKFACFSFQSVWCVTPCLRGTRMCIESFRDIYKLFVSCLCEPFCESFGLVFSKISIQQK